MRRSSQTIPGRVTERVLSRVTADPDRGCLLSDYSVGSHGYAQVGWRDAGTRTMTLCHRVVWIAAHGPIPEGMTVDHMCKQRKCVRVDHLRLLTNFENARRTQGRDWPLGQCLHGHPNSDLARLSTGKMGCGRCEADRAGNGPRRSAGRCVDCDTPIDLRAARCRSHAMVARRAVAA